MHLDLSDATWTDVRDADTDLVLLPVGSTEQHGPHAPLGTDALHAETVAEAGAERHDETVAMAPPISVGVAEEHRQFPGTLWVSPDTFRSYVRDVAGSLAYHGLDRIVVVNGHGGNIPALGEVTATITRHDDAYAVPFTWFEAVGEHGSDMGHGGPLETSLLRCVAPETVHGDRLADAAENGAERWGDWQSGTNLAFDTEEFSPNGVVGDPREGSTERGERLLEAATDALLALFDAVAERRID
jgi:creatinine amidohydrolase